MCWGLLVDMANEYMVKSNPESGFGRYDVVMEPKDAKDTAVIMGFKVYDSEVGEESLEDTAKNALLQIEEKQYSADLLQRGIPEDHILKYGFAFEGEMADTEIRISAVARIDIVQLFAGDPGQFIDLSYVGGFPVRHMEAGEEPGDMQGNIFSDPHSLPVGQSGDPFR